MPFAYYSHLTPDELERAIYMEHPELHGIQERASEAFDSERDELAQEAREFEHEVDDIKEKVSRIESEATKGLKQSEPDDYRAALDRILDIAADAA